MDNMTLSRESDVRFPITTIGSWALFDFANSILIINGGFYFSQWIVVEQGLSETWFNFAIAATSVVVLVTGPILGTFGDRRNMWHQFLWVATFVMFFGTLGIVLASRVLSFQPALVLTVVLLFCVINYSYQLSTLFYNSLLKRLSTPAAYGRVSGWGFAAGWLGAVFGLVAILPFADGSIRIFAGQQKIDALAPAACLYLALSAISLYGMLKLKHADAIHTASGQSVVKHVLNDIRWLKNQRNLLVFFGVYVLLADAVLTIQSNMPLYLQVVMGFSDREKSYLIVGFLFAAAIGATLAGWLADRAGFRRTFTAIVAGWALMLSAMVASTSALQFVFSFACLGFLFGSLWTLLRAIYAKLVPREKTTEFFGLYSAFERLSSVLGPILWGATMIVFDKFGSSRYRVAIGVMIGLIVIALFLISKLQVPEGKTTEVGRELTGEELT